VKGRVRVPQNDTEADTKRERERESRERLRQTHRGKLANLFVCVRAHAGNLLVCTKCYVIRLHSAQ
jgi:hypothetical protein